MSSVQCSATTVIQKNGLSGNEPRKKRKTMSRVVTTSYHAVKTAVRALSAQSNHLRDCNYNHVDKARTQKQFVETEIL